MRLIKCSTLKLKEFFEPDIPPYAILSHTWGQDEVTFKDFTRNRWRHKKGAQKILELCHLALTDKLEYAWIDTCCIDKLSSAELTEAINSMFRWYKSSTYCYVYLSDFRGLSRDSYTTFTDSRWFTRGWTLQELIAPRVIRFYDRNWSYYKSMGDIPAQSNEGLIEAISKKTKVPKKILTKQSLLSGVPVAQIMSWASERQTKRQEDLAYCLLGLFDIHLPLIYGEGTRAFIRLQEEIIREKNDLTIFAWQQPTNTHYRGMLAHSPNEFRNGANIVRLFSRVDTTSDFMMTNKGLKIGISDARADQLWLPLDCYYGDGEEFFKDRDQSKSTLAISLRIGRSGIYMRESLALGFYSRAFEARNQIYVFKDINFLKKPLLAPEIE
jgi:hypothetical protein